MRPPDKSEDAPRRFAKRGASAERIAHHEARGEWPVPGASELVEQRAAASPDRVFLVEGSRRLTFGGARMLAARLAAGLRALGVRTGDAVAWQLPSWIEGAVLTIALDRLGCVSVPLLTIYRETELVFALAQTGARVLIAPGVFRGVDHRELARAVAARAPNVEHVLIARAEPLPGMRSLDALLAEPAPVTELPASSLDPHDVSAVFYTSGTTADPKGVLHTRSSLGSYARANARVTGASAADVSLLQFPLTHIGGIGAFVMMPLLAGSRAVYLDVWSPEAALEAIEREGVTGAGGPPAVLQGLLTAPGFRRERVKTVRVAASGAADVSPDLLRRVRRELAATSFRAYGMTECPMFSSGRAEDAEEKCVLTDGRPTPGCRLRIIGEEGQELPSGREGEIEVFGPQLCTGYLDRTLETGVFTADGFLRSGDLGVVDADGYLTITGRKKDIIIRKGENLSARAIEDALHDHPAVAEAAVVGLPDAERGERVCACVVLKPGTGALTLAEIDRFMTSRGVMRQKIPEELRLLEVLPRNVTGKVKKHELRERFTGGRRNG